MLELLRGHVEPRTAREVADEVAQAHPELKTTVPVVRDALNAHVAKGLVERETRQKSVWYTVVTADASWAAEEAAAEGQPEAETVSADGEPEAAEGS